MTEQPADIHVVGAGFVGLSFAVAAARDGFRVALLDQKPAPRMPDSPSANVIAVNPASADFLGEIDVWDRLRSDFRAPYQRMVVLDGTGTGAIEFGAEEAGLPVLGHIVDQRMLIAALAEAAAETPGLTMAWETEATVGPGDVPLLVGADGAHSRIRESLGLRKIGFSYNQVATTCLVRLSLPHEGVARQWFGESGPLALLPLVEPDLVAVVWSSFDDLSKLPPSAFLGRLEEASEGATAGAALASDRFSFPLMQQQSLQYVTEGVALLGDAAHAIHPLAGQGANLGFADARCLVTELAGARIEGHVPGDLGVLKRYERSRKPHNYMAALAMEGFHRAFTSGMPLVGLARNLGLQFVQENKTLKQLAISVASGRL